MLIGAFKKALAAYTLRTNRLRGLYRRVCRPDGYAWGELLRRHGGLYAIGSGCCIQQNVTITDPAYTRLGSNVHLTGCTIFGHNGSINMLKRGWGVSVDSVGKVDIRDNVFVGHQAMILPGVTIGPNAIVGAGAVVARDVPPGAIVAGVPAQQIGTVAAYVAKLQDEFAALPWREHPQMQAAYRGPADAALDAARVAHWFGGASGAATRDAATQASAGCARASRAATELGHSPC